MVKRPHHKFEHSYGNAARIHVLIADDHPLIRTGLQTTLAGEPDIRVAGEVINGEEVQRLCSENPPDVLLLDLRMPGPSAIETIAYLCQHCPQTRVLILSAYHDETQVRGLVEAGVAGYLLKDEAPVTVVQAIRTVMAGGTWFSRQVAEQLARPTASPALTNREQEVMHLIALGKSNNQIAEELSIAVATVGFHLRNIHEKIGVHTRGEAVHWAMQHNLGE